MQKVRFGSKIRFGQNLKNSCYATSIILAAVMQQIISSITIIMGKDSFREQTKVSYLLMISINIYFFLLYEKFIQFFSGFQRIQRLPRNSRYFRQHFKQLGFITYGNDDSPVVPFINDVYSDRKLPSINLQKNSRNISFQGR